MANTEEGEWLEGLDPQSQQDDYERYTGQKIALYDLGYALGIGDGDRVLQAVLKKIFTYDPVSGLLKTHAEYYSGAIVRKWIEDAKKEAPF